MLPAIFVRFARVFIENFNIFIGLFARSWEYYTNKEQKVYEEVFIVGINLIVIYFVSY